MKAAQQLQIIRFAMLASIILYFVLAETVPAHAVPNPLVLRLIVVLAFADIAVLLVLRKILVERSAVALSAQPDDPVALVRWKTGQLITYALAEAIALYGIVLHFLGFNTLQVSPFFLAGFFLILIFAPRLPEQAR